MAIGVLAVTAGWTALCAWALWVASGRIARYERERPGSAGMFCGVVPLAYALLLAPGKLWVYPITIGVGVWMLRRPELSRQGRITLAFVAITTVLPLWVMALALVARG